MYIQWEKKRYVSICQLIDCRSTSGLRIGLAINQRLNFLVHFGCNIETSKSLFISRITKECEKEGVRQMSGTLRKEIDGILFTLKVGKIELMAKRRCVHFSLGKQSSVEIFTFRDYFGQNHWIGCRCPSQITSYAMIYEGDVPSYYWRNIIIKVQIRSWPV